MAAKVSAEQSSTVEDGKEVGEVEKKAGGDPPSLQKERFGYVFETFARGPDTIFFGSVYFPALLFFATMDSFCDDAAGKAASGKACTADTAWNRSLWLNLGGSACAKELTLGGGIVYEHNNDNVACASALATYQSKTGFTCNCSSEYAFLDSGLRAGNAVNISYIVTSIAVSIVAPLLGAIVDHTPVKKRAWMILAGVASVFTFLSAITGGNGLWQVGLAFATVVACCTEVIWVVKASYLEDIADCDEIRGELGGKSQCYSFGSQILFLVIVVLLEILFTDTLLKVVIGCCILGIWFAVFESVAVSKMQERQPKQPLPPGQSYSTVALHSVKKSLTELHSKYPQAFRYLIFYAITRNGAGAFLSIYTTYFTVQMKLSGIEIVIISLCVLLVGAPAGVIFAKLTQKFSLKKLWYITLGLWIVAVTLTPFLAYQEGDLVSAILLGGCVFAVALSWYYSVNYPAFAALIPYGHSMEYTGLYDLFGHAFSWIGPLIYTAIYQVSNSQRMAMLTLTGWNLLALGVLYFIDFEKGKVDAGTVKSSII